MARKKAERPPDPDRLVRAEAGRYRTEDERFEVSQESASAWYVTDAQRTDELGLARVTGPYATLAAVRAAINELRTAPEPVVSIQAHRQTRGDRKKDAAARPARPPKPPPPPPPPTWIDRLEPGEAARARRLIAAAERAGLPDAERLVRADVEGLAPRLAPAVLLARVWHEAIDAWDGDAIRMALRRPRVRATHATGADALVEQADAEAITELARAVAGETAARVLEIVAAADPADRGLPRWQLDEVDERGERTERRVGVTRDDLAAAGQRQASLRPSEQVTTR